MDKNFLGFPPGEDKPSYGDIPIIKNATGGSGVNDYFEKVAEILVADDGDYRIKFDLRDDFGGAYVSHAAVFRNGAQITQEVTTNSTTATTYTEDTAGWKEGDLLQIYARRSGSPGNSAVVTNVSVFSDVTFTGKFIDNGA